MGYVLVDFSTDRHAHVNTISARKLHTLVGGLASNLPYGNTVSSTSTCISVVVFSNCYRVVAGLCQYTVFVQTGLQNKAIAMAVTISTCCKHFYLFWCLWMNNLIELSTLLYTNQGHCPFAYCTVCILSLAAYSEKQTKTICRTHYLLFVVFFFPVMEKALLMHFLIYMNTNNKHCIWADW